MKKKIILISGKEWSLKYLKESFSDSLLKKTTLITDVITTELKFFSEKKKFHIIKTKKLQPHNLKKLDIKNSIILSCATPWIYKKNIIEIFGKEFFNVHQSPLPSMRGSVASYIILYDIRAFQTCLHRVTTGIDTGEVVFKKDFVIPSNLKSPKEVNFFLQSKNREMVKDFIESYDEKKIIYEKQNHFFASYNKRLSSKINGWIDWSMNVDDLDRFIRAYGDPYGGANTFISNARVKIEDIEKSKNEPARHPEEIGCVLRRFQDYLVVCVNGGTIYIKKIIMNKKNMINKIKPGDRFYTKLKYLDEKNHRVLFVNRTKIYNKNIKIKKINE